MQRLILPILVMFELSRPSLAQDIASTSSAFSVVNVIGGASEGTYNALATGSYWTSNDPPAQIVRLNDRVLIGKSANTWNGSYKSSGTDFTWTMGGGIYAYLPRNAAVISTNSYSEIGALFASRTGDSAQVPGIQNSACCTIGAATLVLNDNVATVQPAWNWYATGVRSPGTGDVLNGEFDVLNATSQVVRAPVYGSNPTGITIGLALNAGGEGAAYNNPLNPPFPHTSASTAALMVMGNGTTFDKGLVIKSAAISPTSDGTTVAIDMPSNNVLRWTYDQTDMTGGYVTSSVSSAAKQIGLELSDNGALFKNRNGTIYGQINLIPGAVNRPILSASVSSQPVQFAAIGSDKSIDVQIAPKGAGRLLTSRAVVADYLQPPIYIAAKLPSESPMGSTAYCSDCREPGQARGAGTGILVFKNASGWRSTAGGPVLN